MVFKYRHSHSKLSCMKYPNFISLPNTGGSLHVKLEHHVWTKFATLYYMAWIILKNYDIFPTYTQALIISFVYFFEKFSQICFFSNYFSSSLRHFS